jgi:hypothetical protein
MTKAKAKGTRLEREDCLDLIADGLISPKVRKVLETRGLNAAVDMMRQAPGAAFDIDDLFSIQCKNAKAWHTRGWIRECQTSANGGFWILSMTDGDQRLKDSIGHVAVTDWDWMRTILSAAINGGFRG